MMVYKLHLSFVSAIINPITGEAMGVTNTSEGTSSNSRLGINLEPAVKYVFMSCISSMFCCMCIILG